MPTLDKSEFHRARALELLREAFQSGLLNDSTTVGVHTFGFLMLTKITSFGNKKLNCPLTMVRYICTLSTRAGNYRVFAATAGELHG